MRVTYLPFVLIAFAVSACEAADHVIDASRAKLSTTRHESITLLEEAVLQSPQRVDDWIELLRALESDSASPFMLRCYAQAALKLNPNSLPLRWEWVRLMEPEAALDELTELAKVEANLVILRDAREILELRLRIPRDWQDGDFYERWATRLIQELKWDRAGHVVARGLRLKPESKPLRICEAMVLATDGKYAESVAAIEKADFNQSLEPQGMYGFPILSDILLAHDQPKWAVKAFGPNPSDAQIKSLAGLILAQATLQAGDTERAEQLFEKADLKGRQLLVIANLLSLKKVDEAHAIADVMIDDWQVNGEQYRLHYYDMTERGIWPISLESKFSQAIKWLCTEYPNAKDLDKYITAHHRLFKPPLKRRKIHAANEALTWLRANMPRLKENPVADNNIFEGAHEPSVYRAYLADQGKFGEAAAHFGQDKDGWNFHGGLTEEAKFALNRQYAEALPFYTDHPAELFRARQLLANLKATRANAPPMNNAVWLTDDEVVLRAAKLDRRIMALVVDGLAPLTLSEQDRSPWARMIANMGTKADVPALLKSLREIVELHNRTAVEGKEKLRVRDQPTMDALNTAIEQLTGVKCPHETSKERLNFWQDWAEQHAAELLTATR